MYLRNRKRVSQIKGTWLMKRNKSLAQIFKVYHQIILMALFWLLRRIICCHRMMRRLKLILSVEIETLWELDRYVTNYRKNLSKVKRRAQIQQARALAGNDMIQVWTVNNLFRIVVLWIFIHDVWSLIIWYCYRIQ